MPDWDCYLWCSCASCPKGSPAKYLVTINVSGEGCCPDLAGAWELIDSSPGEPGCAWFWIVQDPNPCGGTNKQTIRLYLKPLDPEYARAVVSYWTGPNGTPVWLLDGVDSSANCFLSTSLPLANEEDACTWPTAVIKPVADKEEFAECIKVAECLDLCADEGADGSCPAPPPLGPPTMCCYEDDSGEGDDSEECSPCEVARPAVPVTIIGCCPETVYLCPGDGSPGGEENGDCSSGTCDHPNPSASFSKNALSQASGIFSLVRSRMQSRLPSALQRGPGKINNQWGFLNINLGIPNSGPYALPLKLVYNSLGASDQDEYGRGWYLNLALRIVESSHTTRITNGLGLRWNFIEYDYVTGLYSPTDHPVSLKKNNDDSFTATTPDGTAYEFESSGNHNLTTIENSFGSIWTISYDGSDRFHSVEDPTGAFTTISYDGNNYIEKITDPFGRETLFDVDSSSNELLSMTTPEMCVTSFSYDGSNQLTKFTSPEGIVTTYAYDADGWVEGIEHADGSRATLTYEDWSCTEIEDELGNITTVLYEGPRRIGSVVQPTGTTFTYLWDTGPLPAFADSAGNITTFTYREASNRMQQVEEILFPDGGRFTYVYDGSDRVEELIDQNGNRSTLVWDATYPMQRNALIDATGQRWSYTYDMGRVSGKQNPLGEVMTLHYDAQGNLDYRENALGERTTYTYEYGQKKTIENPLGYVTTFIRDDMNRVVQKVDARGFTTSYTYNLNGRLTVVENPLGERTTNFYDARNSLEAIENPLGEITTYGYDSRGNRTTITNPLEEVTTQVYNDDDQLIAVENPLGDRTTFSYDDAGNLQEVINPLGETTTTLYDVMNRPQTLIDARGYLTTTSYDLVGNRVAVENALGHITTSSYNSLNLMEVIEDPLGYRTTHVYDAASQQTEIQNARGFTTTTVYDAAGRVKAIVDPFGYRTTYGYDQAGQRTTVQDARDKTTTTEYDQVGNVRSTIGATTGAWTTTFTYDGLNRQISVQDPLSEVTTTSYDAAGRVLETENPLGYRTTFLYDDAGRRTEVLDAEGNRTTTIYDMAGRAETVENALGHRTTMVYDAAGRREALEDANGHRTTFQYDPAGNVTQETDPLERVTTYTYTALNQQESKHDARDVLATYSYDPIGRLTLREFSDGTPSVTFQYDEVGNRSVMQDASGETLYTYDALNRAETVQQPAVAPITYSYDPVGNRAGMVDPDGGLFTYSYYANNLPYKIDNPSDGRTTLAYFAGGRNRITQMSNGTKTRPAYNADGTIKTMRHSYSNNTDISKLQYSYDKVGNRTEVVDDVSGDITTYTYDATYRLINEHSTGTANYNTTHTYDPVGNRLYEDTGDQRTTFTYDNANQLDTSVEPGGATRQYTYDEAGNLTEEAGLDYQWNAENQLILRGNYPEDYSTFTYNGDGLRVKLIPVHDDDEFYTWIWDQNNLLMEKNKKELFPPTTQAVYTYNPLLYGDLISQRRGSTSHWYLFDALGSTIGLTDSSESVVASYLYKAYGEIAVITSGIVNPFKWLGQVGYYTDSIAGGQFYVRARNYNSTLARWISQDPLGYDEESEWNLYLYVFSSPIGAMDPSGLRPIRDLACEVCACLISGSPVSCDLAQACAEWAIRQRDKSGDAPRKKNALLHCLWMCCMKKAGISDTRAFEIGQIRENCASNNTTGDRCKDEWNNAVGRLLGNNRKTSCLADCNKALQSGLLQVNPGCKS